MIVADGTGGKVALSAMDVREVPPEVFRRHPWEVSRARFFGRVLAGSDLLQGTALDVGAGDGFIARELTRASSGRLRITCWDPAYGESSSWDHPSPLDKTGVRPQSRFDVLLFLDVLEHIEHDAALLGEVVQQNLADGGRVLVSVPAWPSLFGRHGHRLSHFRRYTREALRAMARGVGLEIPAGGGLYHSLLPGRPVMNGLDRVLARDRRAAPPPLAWRHGEVLARLVQRALEADSLVGGAAAQLGLELPGLSEWLLCRLA
jgi:SAM-dependent methyltransferase